MILQILEQPPRQIRTNSARDRRAFSCVVRVNFASEGVTVRGTPGAATPRWLLLAELVYAVAGDVQSKPDCTVGKGSALRRALLGTTSKSLSQAGCSATIHFDDLKVTEASLRHENREFCICFKLISPSGATVAQALTHRFYTYSHPKILRRLQSLKLHSVALSCSMNSAVKSIFIIGGPFFNGPQLGVSLFLSGNIPVVVKLDASLITVVSKSVLSLASTTARDACEGHFPFDKAHVAVTNDGIHLSNKLEISVNVLKKEVPSGAAGKPNDFGHVDERETENELAPLRMNSANIDRDFQLEDFDEFFEIFNTNFDVESFGEFGGAGNSNPNSGSTSRGTKRQRGDAGFRSKM